MARCALLLCLLFAVLVGLGHCLNCHECTTIESDACLDYYNSGENADNVGECDDGSHCLKYKTVARLRDSGYMTGTIQDSIVVTRACEPANDLPTGCIHWQGSGSFTIKCRCDTDECNATGFVRANSMLIGVMMSVLTLVWLVR